MLKLDPNGDGAEHYFESVSETAEREYLESPRYSYYVAEHDGEVISFIAIRDGTHIFQLFVASENQRQGIATALWAHARAHAILSDGANRFTVNSSLNAVAFYERSGFNPSGAKVEAHGIAFLPMSSG